MPPFSGFDGIVDCLKFFPRYYRSVFAAIFQAVPFGAAVTLDAKLIVRNREPIRINQVAGRVSIFERLQFDANPRESDDIVLAFAGRQLRSSQHLQDRL